MNKQYFGVIPPIATPVDERERVDEEALRALVDRCVDGGLHGIFVAGTNGEALALTQAERNRAIGITLDQVAGRIPVICGVMDSSTKRVVENIKALEQMGGTCAAVTSIFYDRHTSQEETVRHMEAIARETAIDLILYNIPPFTGLKLSAGTANRILEIDRVMGYKDSSGSYGEFLTVLERHRDSHRSILQGATPAAISSLLMGADGFVPALAPVFPRLFVDAYNAGRSGDTALALRYNRLLQLSSQILGMSKNATAANKFALSHVLPICHKRVIAPQDTITPEEETRIVGKIEEVLDQHRSIG